MNKPRLQPTVSFLPTRTTRRAVLRLLAASVGALGCGRVADVVARADSQTTHLVTPIAVTDTHPCTGEAIWLTGEIRWVIHVTTDATGGLLLTTQSSAHAAGTGGDGTRYRFQDVARVVIRLSGAGTLVENYTLNHHVIGQGTAADFWLRTRFQLTVNANGETAVIFDESESICR